MRIVRAAIVGSLLSFMALAGCTSASSGALTCSGGHIIATCSLGNAACVEYGGDWTTAEAEANCDSTSGWTFLPGTTCSHSGSTLYGACLAPAGNGMVQRAYDPSDTEGGQEALCEAAGGTWCPITPTTGGGGTTPMDSGALDGAADARVDASEDATADSQADAARDAEHDTGTDAESLADAGDAGVDAGDAEAHEDAGDAAAEDGEATDASPDAPVDANVADVGAD